MHSLFIDADRLLTRLRRLGETGRDEASRLVRVAASQADKEGRDLLTEWMRQDGLQVVVDRIGNIFGVWRMEDDNAPAPLMIGSHIDTVLDAGIFDGSYGVLAGLEVLNALRASGFEPAHPLVVAAFTNEEGVRYTPDMMGSLVHAGGLAAEQALASIGTDGSRLGEELTKIGYAGSAEPGTLRPASYLELHIEQGPVLESESIAIGAVDRLQGISWQRITIDGVANHAGTTPIGMRRDAGLAAARVITFLRDELLRDSATSVATTGEIYFEPNAVNIVPSRATFTVDLRDPIEERLCDREAYLARYLVELADAEGLSISTERLARFEPVIFSRRLVDAIEQAAERRGLTAKRMTSGAGHDAQMMARICDAAMIFVPSVRGISHSPRELTLDTDLVNGANVLLDVVARLTSRPGSSPDSRTKEA